MATGARAAISEAATPPVSGAQRGESSLLTGPSRQKDREEKQQMKERGKGEEKSSLNSPSPVTMLAWTLMLGEEKHARFMAFISV